MPTTSKSRTFIKRDGTLVERRLPMHCSPTHPREMLWEELRPPLGISQSAVAKQFGVSFRRLNEVVNARRSVTPDTALRLAQDRHERGFWLGL